MERINTRLDNIFNFVHTVSLKMDFVRKSKARNQKNSN